MKTSFVIALKIAENSELFFDVEYNKKCLVDSASQLSPEKKEAFENVSLSRRTTTRRIEDIAKNLQLQLRKQIKIFDLLSVALDESCDIRDTAKLLVILRGITKDFQITESLVEMQLIKGTTTSSDLFTQVNAKILLVVQNLNMALKKAV